MSCFLFRFPYLDCPEERFILEALKQLYQFDAIDRWVLPIESFCFSKHRVCVLSSEISCAFISLLCWPQERYSDPAGRADGRVPPAPRPHQGCAKSCLARLSGPAPSCGCHAVCGEHFHQTRLGLQSETKKHVLNLKTMREDKKNKLTKKENNPVLSIYITGIVRKLFSSRC